MNSLQIDLTDKHIIVRECVHSGTNSNPLTRLFHCESGLGRNPTSKCTTIRGRFVANKVTGQTIYTIDASTDIERLATDREVLLARE